MRTAIRALLVGVTLLPAGCSAGQPGGPRRLNTSPHPCPVSPSDATSVGGSSHGPSLSTLARRSTRQKPGGFSFTECFGTPKALVLTSFGSVDVSPRLHASLSSASGAGFVRARVLGATAYVDVSRLDGLPQVAELADHHPWLAYPVRMSLSRPLSELDPQATVRLLSSTGDVRSIGRAHIDGILSYGFEAALRPAQLGDRHASRATVTVYLTAEGEPIRIATLTQSSADTSPADVLRVEDLRRTAKPVSVSAPPQSLTRTITYSQARSINLVP